ncbi:MAG: recombination protein RecR [Erysipelotrichaceae bacterium]|jgi:recombination protein RecR|nr:recombination protein RecR [Erysipelotrichaceae bacterium]
MKSLKPIDRLIESLAKLPSVGRKSAERMAYSLLENSDEDIQEFSDALLNLKQSIKKCPKCGLLIDSDNCPICDDPNRDKTKILVVSHYKDALAIENSDSYNGLYHILNGEISLNKGITVDSLNISSLEERVNEGVEEVIIATNPTIDGETTALYISKILNGSKANVTRLAYGLPMGGNLDYADQITLQKALEGRHKL